MSTNFKDPPEVADARLDAQRKVQVQNLMHLINEKKAPEEAAAGVTAVPEESPGAEASDEVKAEAAVTEEESGWTPLWAQSM